MRSFICGIAVFTIAVATIRAQDMPLSQIIIDGEEWKELASGFPRIDLLRDTSKGIAAYHAKGVERITPSGKRSVADDAEDIQRPTQVQTTRGPAYMIRDGEKPIVYCLKPLRSPVVTPGIKKPAGLTLSASEGSLVVGDAAGKYLWAFRIDKTGTLSAGEPYYPLRVNPGQTESGVTALTTDAAGRVYACTPLGVQVFDPTGRLCGVLQKPGEGDMTAIVFTGENREVLVVACGDKIFVRKMLAKGKPADR